MLYMYNVPPIRSIADPEDKTHQSSSHQQLVDRLGTGLGAVSCALIMSNISKYPYVASYAL